MRKQFAGEILQYETFQGRGQNMDVLAEIKHSQTQIQAQMKIDATA